MLGVEAGDGEPVEALQGVVVNRDLMRGVPEGVTWMRMTHGMASHVGSRMNRRIRSATTGRKIGMTKELKGGASGRLEVGIHRGMRGRMVDSIEGVVC